MDMCLNSFEHGISTSGSGFDGRDLILLVGFDGVCGSFGQSVGGILEGVMVGARYVLFFCLFWIWIW